MTTERFLELVIPVRTRFMGITEHCGGAVSVVGVVPHLSLQVSVKQIKDRMSKTDPSPFPSHNKHFDSRRRRTSWTGWRLKAEP
jgi:hypothetical protein